MHLQQAFHKLHHEWPPKGQREKKLDVLLLLLDVVDKNKMTMVGIVNKGTDLMKLQERRQMVKPVHTFTLWKIVRGHTAFSSTLILHCTYNVFKVNTLF